MRLSPWYSHVTLGTDRYECKIADRRAIQATHRIQEVPCSRIFSIQPLSASSAFLASTFPPPILTIWPTSHCSLPRWPLQILFTTSGWLATRFAATSSYCSGGILSSSSPSSLMIDSRGRGSRSNNFLSRDFADGPVMRSSQRIVMSKAKSDALTGHSENGVSDLVSSAPTS